MCLKFSTSLFLIVIFFFLDLKGQVRYDTSVIKTEPCMVKKVAFSFDSSSLKVTETYKGIHEADNCQVRLQWPLFMNCVSPKMNSTLNYSIKKHVMSRIDHEKPKTWCLENRDLIKGNFSINRFDEFFLSYSLYFFYAPAGGTPSNYKRNQNYNLKKQSYIELWDMFKPKYPKETIKKRIRKLNDYKKGKNIGIESGCMINLRDKIVIENCGGPVLYSKLTIKKKSVKKYLKEEYYHD
jgi:hypothetical protein